MNPNKFLHNTTFSIQLLYKQNKCYPSSCKSESHSTTIHCRSPHLRVFGAIAEQPAFLVTYEITYLMKWVCLHNLRNFKFSSIKIC